MQGGSHYAVAVPLKLKYMYKLSEHVYSKIFLKAGPQSRILEFLTAVMARIRNLTCLAHLFIYLYKMRS